MMGAVQFPYAVEIQFSPRTPSLDAFGDVRPELLVKAKPTLSQYIRIQSISQLRHGFTLLGQCVSKLALQISFNTLRFDGLGFDDRPHPFFCVHCRQSSSQQLHSKFFPSLMFTDLLEFLWGRFENAQPLALALCVQTRQCLAK